MTASDRRSSRRYFWRVVGSVIEICQLPASCTCSVEGQAMIWRSSPLYSSTSRACSLRKTCWMLFCAREGKKDPVVTECQGKINPKFPSGLCPLTILFPCQRQHFGFSHSAFTWHLDERYTVPRKIPLLHGCRGKVATRESKSRSRCRAESHRCDL